jgi:magnesium chelatase family protein
MLCEIQSVANFGLDTVGVTVEVNVDSRSFPAFSIVGLPNKAVKEARERVKTALGNSNVEFPQKRVTINLAPADIPKEGSCYDLPIAVGIMSLMTGFSIPKKSLFYGELSLNGDLRHTRGAFLAALWAAKHGIKNIFVPKDSANEASVIEKVEVYPVESLADLALHLYGQQPLVPLKDTKINPKRRVVPEFDFADILGQEQAKRAVEIAAAGGHNIFLVGPPGAGKTMLAQALPGILPCLTKQEALEVTKIYSVAGYIPPGGSLVENRPFRSPHHNVSKVGLIGGGSTPMPGEISLAHRGVLFLDEVPEFGRSTLEALRQPLEDGRITISRAAGHAVYPSQFILVAAANPCPCGYSTHPERECTCTAGAIFRYRKKLSGPLMDRIDLHIQVPPVKVKKLTVDKKAQKFLEKSSAIRKRVTAARQIQSQRFKNLPIHTNAEMKNKQLRQFCQLDKQSDRLLKQAIDQFQLSARAYFRLIKIARTIADLAAEQDITSSHIAEALQYRVKG